MPFFVYLLKSRKNGKSYVGRTGKEPTKRLAEHNLGSNVWTSQNGPFDLVYYESFFCKEDAINREKFLKSGIGKKIKRIILENL
jgi:putative endonuclease